MKSLFNDIITILKSRTVITILIMFAFNLVDAFAVKMDAQVVMVVNALLTAVAAFFRVKPKQNFNK